MNNNVSSYVDNPKSFVETWPAFGEANLFGLLSRACRDGDTKAFEDYLSLLENLSSLPISGLLVSYLSQGWIIELLERLQTNEYHQKALASLKNGEKIGSFCLTEPGGGSSYKNLKTRASRSGDTWDIEGTKIYITNAAFADYFIVAANTGLDKGQQISFFLLEKDAVTVEEEIDFIGNHNSGISRLGIECHNLSEEHLLGKEGGGFFSLPYCLNFERMDIAIASIYLIREAFRRTNAFLKTRKNADEMVLNYQVIRHKLVDAYMKLEVARTFVLSTAAKLLAKEECSKEIIIAKINATETARDVILELIQLTGAYGFTKESGLITMFNDIAPLTVGGGANTVLRNILYRNARSVR